MKLASLRTFADVWHTYFADGDRGKKAMKGKAKGKPKGKVKNAKQNSDDEAIEESDEGDYDDREVDYMSDTSR